MVGCLFCGPRLGFCDHLLAVEADGFGALAPVGSKLLAVVHIELWIAAVLRDAAQAFGRCEAELFAAGEDLGTALTELVDRFLGHPVDFELAVLAGDAGLVPQLGQFLAEGGMVGRANDRVVFP